MKYSKNFERDFTWYMSMRHQFTFSGDHLRDKAGEILRINPPLRGARGVCMDGKQAFYLYDSTGVLHATRHPNLLFTLLKVKASANFHVKELYAKDRATGLLSRTELEEIYAEIKPPEWFKKSVEEFTEKFKHRNPPLRGARGVSILQTQLTNL